LLKHLCKIHLDAQEAFLHDGTVSVLFITKFMLIKEVLNFFLSANAQRGYILSKSQITKKTNIWTFFLGSDLKNLLDGAGEGILAPIY